MSTVEYELVRNDVHKYKLKIEREIKKFEELKKKEREAKKKEAQTMSSIMTRSKHACKLFSFSESDSEGLDLEKMMDDGVLHNTASDNMEDIMQKPNEDIMQKDNGDDIENEETPKNHDNSESKGTVDEETEKNEIVDEKTEKQGDNIMQKTDRNVAHETENTEKDIMQKNTAVKLTKDLNEDSDDDMTLAAVLQKEKAKTRIR